MALNNLIVKTYSFQILVKRLLIFIHNFYPRYTRYLSIYFMINMIVVVFKFYF